MTPQRRITHALNQIKIAERLLREARAELIAAIRAGQPKPDEKGV